MHRNRHPLARWTLLGLTLFLAAGWVASHYWVLWAAALDGSRAYAAYMAGGVFTYHTKVPLTWPSCWPTLGARADPPPEVFIWH